MTKRHHPYAYIAATLLVAVLLTAAAVCAFFPSVLAEGQTEIKIRPDSSSVYAAADGHFAYTTQDGTLHLSVTGAAYERASAFAGTALGLAMTDDTVFLLSDLNGKKSLTAFGYADNGIGAGEDAFSALGISASEYVNFADFFDSVTIAGDTLVVTAGGFAQGSQFLRLSLTDSSSSHSVALGSGVISDSAAVTASEVWFVSDGKLFSFDGTNYAEPVQTGADNTWLSVAVVNGTVFAAAQDGIYAVDSSSVTKISDEIADGTIRSYTENGAHYLLVQNRAQNSVTQYSLLTENGNVVGLRYYNVFDNVVYSAPAQFTILTAGKVTQDAQAFFSPKNLKPVADLSAGSYVLVLAEADGYYYIRTGDEMCYVPTDAIALLECGEGWKHGDYAAATTDGLQVLLYPYDGAQTVATVGPKDALFVIGDIGTDNGAPVTGWLKVSLIGEDGDIVDGYVDESALGPYGPYRLPSFGKDATVNVDRIGDVVYVYSLPEEREDFVIGTLTDGEVVELAQDGINVNDEWTAIAYEDADGNAVTGYVKTAYLSDGGLTTLQITLIVVCCIVAAVTVAVVIIIAKKRKRERYE